MIHFLMEIVPFKISGRFYLKIDDSKTTSFGSARCTPRKFMPQVFILILPATPFFLSENIVAYVSATGVFDTKLRL